MNAHTNPVSYMNLVSSKPGCIIKYGIHDRHVSDSIIDNQEVYKLVFEHVKGCSYCNPIEILQAYLERRATTDKFHGLVTGTFMAYFSKYAKLLKERGIQIPRALAAEFYCRLGDLDDVLKYGKNMTLPELLQAAIYTRLSGQYDGFGYVPDDPKMVAIWQFVVNTNMQQMPDDPTEIENLIAVAEVMLS